VLRSRTLRTCILFGDGVWVKTAANDSFLGEEELLTSLAASDVGGTLHFSHSQSRLFALFLSSFHACKMSCFRLLRLFVHRKPITESSVQCSLMSVSEFLIRLSAVLESQLNDSKSWIRGSSVLIPPRNISLISVSLVYRGCA
jgi:hypothetical protein